MKPLTVRGKAQDFYYLPASGHRARDGALSSRRRRLAWLRHRYGEGHGRLGLRGLRPGHQTLPNEFHKHPTLTAEEMRGDMLEVARQVKARNVLLVGWSQGAAMAALAGSSPKLPRSLVASSVSVCRTMPL